MIVRVKAPARLHLGLIDVAGRGPRRFGGLGVALREPVVAVVASPHDELATEGPDADRALVFARRCCDALGLPAAGHVRIEQAIPAHVGLGSGTKLALAVGHALTALHGVAEDSVTLASASGRAGRSAVGLWTFARGGFVVDGGVRPEVPRPGALLTRHPMPEHWRCVLALPRDSGLSGVAEEQAFRRLEPDSDRAAEVTWIVLRSLLPALVEQDLIEFGAALTQVQRLVGEEFASVQGGCFHPRAGELVEALLALGAAGAGQSSWGPAAFGLVGCEADGLELARRLEDELPGRASVRVLGFHNGGVRVEAPCVYS
ncbi:MAG TPA: beta-ribofuranosylaminobenzene 5'-phosphate synthase family protein [Solirubrobacteraceae bacterium]